jgi:hypothetical protein
MVRMNTAGEQYAELSNAQTVIDKAVGVWIKVNAWGAATTTLTVLRGLNLSSTVKWTLKINSDGSLDFNDSTGALATSQGSGFDTGWHFYEIFFEESSSGSWAVKVDGSTVASGVSNGDFTTSVMVDTQLFKSVDSGSASDVLFYCGYVGTAGSASDLRGQLDVFVCAGDNSATVVADPLDIGTWPEIQEFPLNETNYAQYNVQTGQSEREAPDAITLQTNLTGSVTDIDDDPDSPDANWLTASGKSTLRTSFPTPSITPTGSQNFRVLLRKNATGGGTSGTDNVVPNGIGALDANLNGDETTIDDDPGSWPGGDWRTAASNNANSVCHAQFGTPVGPPNGTQTFHIYARLTANGTAADYNVYLYENGTQVGAAIASGQLTSTTGQTITATFNASSLGTADGSLVECVFEVIKTGGSPGSRTTGEVDAIYWECAYQEAEFTPAYQVQLYENGSLLGTAETGTLTDAGGNTVVQCDWDASLLATADGSLVECYVNQTDASPSRYVEVGAVEWNAAAEAEEAIGHIVADSGARAGPLGRGSGTILRGRAMHRMKTTGVTSTAYAKSRVGVYGGALWSSSRTLNAAWTDYEFNLDQSSPYLADTTEESLIGFGIANNATLEAQCAEAYFFMAAEWAAGAITVQPNSVPSAKAVPQPAIDFGTLVVEASTLASSATVEQPAIDLSIQVQPQPVASAAALQQPEIVLGVLTVEPQALASPATIEQPSIDLGSLTVEAQAVASDASVEQPALDFTLTVQPQPVASAATVAQPSIDLGTLAVQPQPVSSATAVEQPAIAFGTLVLQPVSLASSATVEQPAILTEVLLVQPNTVASQAALQQPALEFGTLTVQPQPVSSAATVPQPAIDFSLQVIPQAVASEAAVEQPEIALGTLLLEINAVASLAAVPQPSVDLGTLLLDLQPVASQAAVPQPAVEILGITIQAQAVPSQATVPQPAILPGAITIQPQAVPSQATVEQPGLALNLAIDLQALTGQAVVYQPQVDLAALVLQPQPVASAASVELPSLGLSLDIALQTVPSQVALYQPQVDLGTLVVDLDAVPSLAQVYLPSTDGIAATLWHEAYVTDSLDPPQQVTASLDGLTITASLEDTLNLTK